MQPIELKINPKPWAIFFAVVTVLATFIVQFMADGLGYTMPIHTAFIFSVILNVAAFSYYWMIFDGIRLTDTEIKKTGFRSNSIPYADVQKIIVGLIGYQINGKNGKPITLTKFHSGFDVANSLINQKIKDRNDIKITGMKVVVDMYFER